MISSLSPLTALPATPPPAPRPLPLSPQPPPTPPPVSLTMHHLLPPPVSPCSLHLPPVMQCSISPLATEGDCLQFSRLVFQTLPYAHRQTDVGMTGTTHRLAQARTRRHAHTHPCPHTHTHSQGLSLIISVTIPVGKHPCGITLLLPW